MPVVVLLIKGSFDFFFLDSYFFFFYTFARREKKTRREVTFKEMPWCRGITVPEKYLGEFGGGGSHSIIL